MKQMTGKQLEKYFGIRQQYRSRYDKAYCNFISQSDAKPRLYDEADITAYDVILKSLENGLTRPKILGILANMANDGDIPFFPSETIPELKALLEDQTPTVAPNKEEKPKKQKRQRPPRISHIELIERVATLNAQVEIYNEQLGDCLAEIETLRKSNTSLSLRMAILENNLTNQGILVPANKPTSRPEEGTPKSRREEKKGFFRSIVAVL